MGYNLCANERQYQMMIDLSPLWTRLHPALYDPQKLRTNPYDLPYRVAASSVAIQCALPLVRFAALPWGPRAVVGSLLLCLPVYFGSVLYVQLFESSRHRDMALGLNVLGAFAGGLVETASLALGLQAVSLLTLEIYALAGVASLWSGLRAASASAEEVAKLAAGHEGASFGDGAPRVEHEHGGNAGDVVALR